VHFQRVEKGKNLKKTITIKVNGVKSQVDVGPYDLLNRVLREYLGLTGTKKGCDYGGCGSCTVLLDGRAVYSCMVPAYRLTEKNEIQTIEGLAESDNALHPIQESFLRNSASQCGFSTPGMVMSAVGLLKENPNPSDDEIRQAISGNLCRCTGYVSIIRAISDAASKIRSQDHQ
jgi:carbon-monoxide dehydrogenase small subunit